MLYVNRRTIMTTKEQLRKDLHRAIHSGQHCQRAFDLDQVIPQEDIDLIIEAATQCPSKQNSDFYSVMAITDRDTIEKIYKTTQTENGARFNPQTLANLLLIFNRNEPEDPRSAEQIQIAFDVEEALDEAWNDVETDRNQAVGIAAGFVNVTASMLGYKTGCNKCFYTDQVREVFGDNEMQPILMMGIGFPDKSIKRNVDPRDGQEIDTFPKAPIKVTYV